MAKVFGMIWFFGFTVAARNWLTAWVHEVVEKCIINKGYHYDYYHYYRYHCYHYYHYHLG